MSQPIPKRREPVLRCRTYKGGNGILTVFPFRCFLLGALLGPTDPWLMSIAKEPLPFRWQGFSPCSDPTTARILISEGSTSSLEDASAPTERLLTLAFAIHGIGNRFSPVHFQGPRPRRVSCYALFKGWLLLSQPPRCLRPRTLFTR